MKTAAIIFAVARADFLERVRRYSFFVTLMATVYLGYAAATGKVVLSLDNHRGVYTAGWIGLMVALVTTTFVSLIGFYVVKNAVERDRLTRVGQILSATPLSKYSYMAGKFVSNFAVLASVVLILALGAIVMFFIAAEDPHFQLWALLSPFLLVALPTMALTAAVALLFENVPFLRGGFGNVVWCFAWGFSIALPDILQRPDIDPLGLKTAMESLLPIARATIPGYKNGISLTIANGHAVVEENLHFAGLPWSSHAILLRLLWVGVAIVITLFAAMLCDRFDDARSLWPALGFGKGGKAKVVVVNTATAAVVSNGKLPVAVHLTPLNRTRNSAAFLRIFQAELRLTLQGNRWWWYIIAAGLLIAEFSAPLRIARGPLLQFAWLWPTLLWSALGARETRYVTRQILFSCANILPRQLLASFVAGVAIALLMSCGTLVRLVLAEEWPSVLAVVAGTLFVPALALTLGVVSGSSKFFEGLYTAWWYIGPLNRGPGLDFTGASNGALTGQYALLYISLATILLFVAYMARARQLRGA